jgi:kynurenine formamidase
MKPPAVAEWFDLSLPLSPAMPVYPGDPPVAFLRHTDLRRDGFQVTAVRLGTHAGTHLDAPAHFLGEGATVDRLALEALVGPARVVDVSDVPPGGRIEVTRLGRIVRGERLLLRTDWGKQFGCPGYYLVFPSLSEEAVEKLASRRVALLGLETPSICAEHEADAAAHVRLLGCEMVIVEGLRGLDRLPPRVWLAALPLPLVGLDGSPCRVIAVRR